VNAISEESGPLPYLLSRPPAASPPGGWPLLCFLHGRDEGPPSPIREGVTAYGPLASISARVATAQFVVVAPQLPERGDGWQRYADAVRTIVQQVQARYEVDSMRRYLTGFSYGANGVLDLAPLQRDFWAALWSVDPTRVPAADSGRPIWFSSGELSRPLALACMQRLQLAPLDDSVAQDCVYTDEGLDHVGTGTHAYRDERIYRWLLSKTAPVAEPT
jgi:predicted peptidase